MTVIILKEYENGAVREFSATGVTLDVGHSDPSLDNPLQGIMHTTSDGDVAVSLVDSPEIWDQLIAAGLIPDV